MDKNDYIDKLSKLQDENYMLINKLAACEIIALSDTPESMEKVSLIHKDFQSSASGIVLRSMRELIRLREENRVLTERLEKMEDNR